MFHFYIPLKRIEMEHWTKMGSKEEFLTLSVPIPDEEKKLS